MKYHLYGMFLAFVSTTTIALPTNHCPQHYSDNTPPKIIVKNIRAKTQELCFTSFVVMHSGVTRTPLWSAEYLTPTRIHQAASLDRQNNFHAEDNITENERAELNDYKRSGYDRGHLSPNHDMPDRESQYESFSLANIIPQAPKINQGVWAGIENAVRQEVLKGKPLYVITGSIFDSPTLIQLNHRVFVPNSIFKAVYDPKQRLASAYIATNDKNSSSKSYEVVSIEVLEKRIGINLFPTLSKEAKQTKISLPAPNTKSRD